MPAGYWSVAKYCRLACSPQKHFVEFYATGIIVLIIEQPECLTDSHPLQSSLGHAIYTQTLGPHDIAAYAIK